MSSMKPAMENLHRASRALADHIAEFDTIIDPEFLNDLERALDAVYSVEPEPCRMCGAWHGHHEGCPMPRRRP